MPEVLLLPKCFVHTQPGAICNSVFLGSIQDHALPKKDSNRMQVALYIFTNTRVFVKVCYLFFSPTVPFLHITKRCRLKILPTEICAS